MKPKYFYTLSRHPGDFRGVEFLSLRIHRATEDRYRFHRDELFHFKWQGSSDIENWYGFHFVLDCDSNFATCQQRIAAAATILKRLADTHNRVDKVIPALNLPRLVYDDREDRYLLPEAVKPESHKRWMARLEGSCVVAAVAEGVDEARRALTQAWAAEVTEQPASASRFSQWVTLGSPVEMDSARHMPDVRPIEVIITPMKVPVAIAA